MDDRLSYLASRGDRDAVVALAREAARAEDHDTVRRCALALVVHHEAGAKGAIRYGSQPWWPVPLIPTSIHDADEGSIIGADWNQAIDADSFGLLVEGIEGVIPAPWGDVQQRLFTRDCARLLRNCATLHKSGDASIKALEIAYELVDGGSHQRKPHRVALGAATLAVAWLSTFGEGLAGAPALDPIGHVSLMMLFRMCGSDHYSKDTNNETT